MQRLTLSRSKDDFMLGCWVTELLAYGFRIPPLIEESKIGPQAGGGVNSCSRNLSCPRDGEWRGGGRSEEWVRQAIKPDSGCTVFEKDTGIKISLHTLLHTRMPSTLNFKHADQNKNSLLLKNRHLYLLLESSIAAFQCRIYSYVEKYADNIVLILTVSDVSRMNSTFSERIREHVMDNWQFMNHQSGNTMLR